jgi:hypothetical protein
VGSPPSGHHNHKHKYTNGAAAWAVAGCAGAKGLSGNECLIYVH